MSYFNPRSPHGERPYEQTLSGCPSYFNPRSPHGERLPFPRRRPARRQISTHAPRTGSDTAPGFITASAANFNPRSPHGERRANSFAM